MPAVDYVSIVKSAYDDRTALILGAVATTLAAIAVAYHAHSAILYTHVPLFVIMAVLRDMNVRAFNKAHIEDDDADAAEYWEHRQTISGAAAALIYGTWCYSCFVFVDDPFAPLTSSTMCIGVLVGTVTRNFGLKQLVTAQTALVCGPIAVGLLQSHDVYYMFLAVLLIFLIAGFGKLADDIRGLLLGAVHGRTEATRLAKELDTALATMPYGLCMIDSTGRITVINEHVSLDFVGQEGGQLIGKPLSAMIEAAFDAKIISASTAEYLLAELKKGVTGKLVIGLTDGRHSEITISTDNGYAVVMLEDISDRVRAHNQISHMARYDGLTELPNRSFFSEQVSASLAAYSAIDDPSPVMMMIVDVDDFKHVNDLYGHPVGDALLREVAARLRQVFGSEALVGRFGGDEFTVFRTGDISTEVAAEDAQAVLALLRVPFALNDDEITVNASVGVVIEKGADTDFDILLTRADLALYDCKSKGKGQWCMFHDQMDVEYRQRQRLKADLEAALAQDQLFLHYQPIIEVQTRRIVGCEALVRWDHPELGMIPPSLFVPIAEEIGVITALSRFVLDTAVHECLKWPDHMNVQVNLSATDFRTVKVEDMVMQALQRSGLKPCRLTLEITETALLEEQEKVAKALTAVRKRGVGVALDDFGTGYSSLAYLQSITFTKVKIDRSFVVDVARNPRAQILLTNIARLSRDLDMTVTVEGIETEEQLETIIAAAPVEFAQGYLFGAPLPARDVQKLITSLSPNEPFPTEKERRAVRV